MAPPIARAALLTLPLLSCAGSVPGDRDGPGGAIDGGGAMADTRLPDAWLATDGTADAAPVDASPDLPADDLAAMPDLPPGADLALPPLDLAATPRKVFGSRYWDVYRPAFFATFYQSGRVSDRSEAGTLMFGDNTLWMGILLSTMVYEYRAAHLDDSLRVMSEILAAYEALDTTWGDPLDGYVYRSDRGPDYKLNWIEAPPLCPPPNGLCLKQCYLTRDDEPSGDQIFGTLRALRDVVDSPDPLVWQNVDLKAKARARAALLGSYLRSVRFQMTNKCGDPVKRGPDQRWGAWTFQQAAARISGQPIATFQTSWDLLGVPVAPPQHHDVSKWFVDGCWKFSRACMGGKSITIGGLKASVGCNEFNVDLGGDAAVMACSEDPKDPDWFSAWVATADIVAEGNALYALYARLKFKNPDPALAPVARRFLDAPQTPPTGENLDPNGWCVSWRWAHDFSDPGRCKVLKLGARFTGLDYMLPRAMASAFGEFPE